MEVAGFTFGSILTTLLAGTATLLLLLWYLTSNHQYWKKRNIPYVKPIPVFGNVLETFKKSLHAIETERYKKYGRVYGHYEGSRPVISVGEPSLLKNIFVKDFHAFTARRGFETGEPVMDRNVSVVKGEDWKRIRSIITPTFTTGKLKRMMNIFKECSQVCVSNFMKTAKSGEPFNVKKNFEAFTMDVIASSSFSTKIDSHNDPNNKFVATAKDLFKNFLSWRFMFYLMFPKVLHFFGISALSLKEVYFFRDLTLEIIEERKRTGKVRNDFLQLLLDTAKEVEEAPHIQETQISDDLTANYGKEESNEKIFKSASKKELSNTEVISQCVTFFVAGFDATASTLSFAFYNLALNPDLQEKLISEIDEALAAENGKLTYETIQGMKYLDNVISETLRMFPPAVRTERIADEDYGLGYKGVEIPNGMLVTIPIYAIHHDPKNYPDPEKFDPNRFSPEERAKRDQLVYMPFGIGPRNCIGMRFVLMLIKVCLAFLLSNFRFKKCAQTKVPMEFLPGQFMLTPKDITLQLEIRKDGIRAH